MNNSKIYSKNIELSKNQSRFEDIGKQILSISFRSNVEIRN